ncbi:MAG: adenosylcobinamide amidohydrolase [Fibrobacterota bacterium]|nr:adenosylcobinamide amidohydrolase [Fibrobacterota bacterium]
MPHIAHVDAIKLLDTEGFSLHRRGRFLSIHLKKPHLTLSTSHVNGGQSEQVTYLLNHQSCEGKGHMGRHDALEGQGQEAYHRSTCGEAGIPAEATAMMGTAANMQYASVREESFEEVSVWAVATAGVQGNAGRAGDPATWHESSGNGKPLHAIPGTINIMLLFNWPLLANALAGSVATLTEAKTAALLELAVPSRYSPHLATGTGTDQFCVTSPLDGARKPKTWTGKHSKLGEILGRAVTDAVKEALRWQNGLEPSHTRNLIHALGRFGLTEAGLLEAAGMHLSEKDRDLFRANIQAVVHEPLVAGAAYALAAVFDRIAFGTLPESSGRELLANQAAMMAAGLAAKSEAYPAFRVALVADDRDLPALTAMALALGWREKWK